MFKNVLRKLMPVMLAAFMLVGVAPGQQLWVNRAYAAGDSPDANGANGLQSKPYIINEESDFAFVLTHKNNYFLQTADINLTGPWTPIGSNSTPFTGTYNGNGHIISNLTINDGTLSYAAMFGYTSGATIKNLTLSNVNISGGQNVDSAYIAGIVGMNTNTSVIERCRITGGIIAAATNDTVGGIAGGNGGTIRYCSNTAAVQSGSYDAGSSPYTGGIAGLNYGTIADSFNTGTVTAGNTGTAGGITGFGYSNTVARCYSIGNVSAGVTNSCAGAIVGRIQSAASVSDNYYLAGSAASGIGDLDPANNYSDANIPSDAGCTPSSAANLKLQGTYTNWDFGSNIWTIDGGVNNGYPFLKQVPVLDATVPAAAITHTTATSGGNVTDDGYGAISEWGVEYGKGVDPLTKAAASSGGTSNYSLSLSGLIPDTQYYTRAYAINEAGTAYGEPVVFTTLPAAPALTVTIAPGSVIGAAKAVITGAATSKFVVNITDSSVGYISTDDDAPAAGANFIDNYVSGTDITNGVAVGKYLQVYDVGADGKVVKFYEIRLANQHIKNAAVSLPITEGFEHGGNMPDNWSEEVLVTSPDGNIDWSADNNDPYGSIVCSPRTGSYMATANFYMAGQGATGRLSLINDFALPAGLSYEFSFYMFHSTATYEGYGAADTIQPQVSLDSGVTWSDLGAPILRTSTDGWVKHTLSLNDYAGSPTVKIGLLAISDYGIDAFIDDVEIKELLNPAKILTPDTANNDVDHDIEVTFGADAAFEGVVTGVSFNGNALTANQYTVSGGKVTLKPGNADNNYLRTPATGNVVIMATGYDNSIVAQSITAGAAASLTISTQPVPGAASGDAFATQPVINLKDQYSNICATGPSATANVVATAKTGTGTWTIGGTTTKAAVAGVATFTDLTCALVTPGDGAITFTSGAPTVDSSTFTIPLGKAKTLTADTTSNDVDNNIEITFADDATFRAAITGVTFNGSPLTTNQYTTTTAGKIILHPGNADNNYLRTPATADVVIVATGYNNSTVAQTITAGAVASLVVTQQPVPGANGGAFTTQPVVTLKDQYNNICATGSSATVNVVATAKSGTGTWTIGGTSTKTAVAGVATFTDLTCALVTPGNGAITFTSGAPTVDSNTFALPAPPTMINAARTDNTHITVTLSKNCTDITKANDGGFTVQETGAPGTTYAVSAIAQGADASHVVLTVADMGISAKEGVTVKYTAGGNGTVQDTLGNAMLTDGTGVAAAAWDTTSPAISSGTLAASSAYIDVTFDEGVYGANDGTTAVSAAKLSLTFTQNGGAATNVVISSVKQNDDVVEGSASNLAGGETIVRVFLTVTGTPNGLETIEVKPADGASIYDKAGNAVPAAQTTGVKTLNDQTPPYVSTYSPADGATDVSGTANLVLTFSENVIAVAAKNVIIKKSSDDTTVETIPATSGQVTGSGSATITINPSVTLASEEAYYVQIDAGAFKDAGDNPYAGIADATTWNFTVADNTPALAITTGSLPDGMVGTSYSATLTASGGTGSYTWSATGLPLGLYLNTVTANVYGTPTTAGTSSVSASVYDDGGHNADASFSLTVNPAPSVLTITTSSLPNGRVGTPYNATLTASGGTEPYTWDATGLPTGLTINQTSGLISGIPASAGTYSVSAAVYDSGGDSANASFSLTISSASSNNNNTSPTQQPDSTAPNVEIMVNGKSEGNTATTSTTTVGDRTVTTVVLDPQKLEEKLKQESGNTVVTIPVNTNADTVIGQLTGQIIKSMEQKSAVVEIKTENASYTLPTAQINIDDVSAQLGQNVELKDINVNIEISRSPDETVQFVEDAAEKNNLTIVVPPVDFKVTCTYGNKTVEVNSFSAFVERTIAIPEGIDPQKVTTAVIMNSDGTLTPVPTKIVARDGKYYAVINSLTNSTYTVIWHTKTFKDMENHWAKDYVNEMGSRLVVSGVDENNFSPDRDVTRAEFAAIIVRALGLSETGKKNNFSDVTDKDWFNGAISAAYEHGIINGYNDGTFNPQKAISREEAMVIIARAVKLAGIDADGAGADMDASLAIFKDNNSIDSWARNSAAACVKLGIVIGDNNMLAPDDDITRAQAATTVMRMLQKANLI